MKKTLATIALAAITAAGFAQMGSQTGSFGSVGPGGGGGPTVFTSTTNIITPAFDTAYTNLSGSAGFVVGSMTATAANSVMQILYNVGTTNVSLYVSAGTAQFQGFRFEVNTNAVFTFHMVTGTALITNLAIINISGAGGSGGGITLAQATAAAQGTFNTNSLSTAIYLHVGATNSVVIAGNPAFPATNILQAFQLAQAANPTNAVIFATPGDSYMIDTATNATLVVSNNNTVTLFDSYCTIYRTNSWTNFVGITNIGFDSISVLSNAQFFEYGYNTTWIHPQATNPADSGNLVSYAGTVCPWGCSNATTIYRVGVNEYGPQDLFEPSLTSTGHAGRTMGSSDTTSTRKNLFHLENYNFYGNWDAYLPGLVGNNATMNTAAKNNFTNTFFELFNCQFICTNTFNTNAGTVIHVVYPGPGNWTIRNCLLRGQMLSNTNNSSKVLGIISTPPYTNLFLQNVSIDITNAAAVVNNSYALSVDYQDANGQYWQPGPMILNTGTPLFSGGGVNNVSVLHSNAWNLAAVASLLQPGDNGITQSNGVPVIVNVTTTTTNVYDLTTGGGGIIP